MTRPASILRLALAAMLALCAGIAGAQLRAPSGALVAPAPPAPGRGDFIVAIVNQMPITNNDVQNRLERIVGEAQARGQQLPPRSRLLSEVLNQLIDERAQLDHARETGVRLDSGMVDEAVRTIAARNGLTVEQLRQEVVKDGLDYDVFTRNVREELLLQRVREREVAERIRISDADVDEFLARQTGEGDAQAAEYNIAQILIAVPETAGDAERAKRREAAEALRARALGGEPFEDLARAHSDAPDKVDGGVLGLRRGDRLPTLFIESVKSLPVGGLSPVLQSGAGFHVLKLIERREAGGMAVTQTRARHILLRADSGQSEAQRLGRLRDFARSIGSGQASFEQLARDFSEDASGPAGGDLGWAVQGQFVPEFEQVMNRLAPGEVSEPFVSRFGSHLLQVVERREIQLTPAQRREVARNALREQRFEPTYEEWAREIRDRAYIEMRDLPQ